MLRESQSDEETENGVGTLTDDKICCAQCGILVTRDRWRLSINQDHEHTVFNPHGRVFRVLCFAEALNVVDHGDFSDVFTWFKGYTWVITLCQGCGAHLGWRYQGETTPRVFFGFIKPKLVS